MVPACAGMTEVECGMTAMGTGVIENTGSRNGNPPDVRNKRAGLAAAMRCLLIGHLVIVASVLGRTPARAAEAKAAPPPVSIAILTSSRTDQCFDTGNIAAITRLATLEADRINGSSELGGRKIKLEFLDDQRDPKKAVANMRGALANPSTVAVLGLANSATAKVLFDTAGKDIRDSGVPFISDLSVNSLFADYANVFTHARLSGQR